MTYAKLSCVKVFVYIIAKDISYVTIIILNGLKGYFCQRPPDWISTYKTTYIRQNRSFLRRLCVKCCENRELPADLRRHERTEPKLWFSSRAVTHGECVGVFLNEMNASFFTIASLSLKIAEIATSGWSTLSDIEISYFKGGNKKSYCGTLFDHRQMLFKNSANKTER